MIEISNKNMVTLVVTRWEEVVTRSLKVGDVPKSQNLPPKLI